MYNGGEEREREREFNTGSDDSAPDRWKGADSKLFSSRRHEHVATYTHAHARRNKR